MPSRRLEERIRDLCGQAISEKDDRKLMSILEELREALRQHATRMRDMTRENLITASPPSDRRRK
jgi:hypothetical protein